MANFSRSSIPREVLAAKAEALKSFLPPEPHPPVLMAAFAARSNPRSNVVGIGVGKKGDRRESSCVRFYVEHKLPHAIVPSGFMLPETLRGVPTEVVESGRFRALARHSAEQRFLRPARPGCSVGFSFGSDPAGGLMAGTFGAVVTDGKKLFILSNNHVLANENNLKRGSPIYQPGLLDKNAPEADRIAELSRFVRLRVDKPNAIDCAIAQVLDQASVDPVVMPNVGALRSGTPRMATMQMAVEKTGRTSGYTRGEVSDVSATLKVEYELGTLTFSDQIVIVDGRSPFSVAGDSGSLIVERKSKRPVGLLFAGSTTHTVANHIEDVLDKLKVKIVAQVKTKRRQAAKGSKRSRVRETHITR